MRASAVFAALGSEVRLKIVKMLLERQPLCVTEIAAALGRKPDGVGQHLIVLLEAGVVQAFFGQDRRQTVYSIPESYRTKEGLLDFGVCTVQATAL